MKHEDMLKAKEIPPGSTIIQFVLDSSPNISNLFNKISKFLDVDTQFNIDLVV